MTAAQRQDTNSIPPITTPEMWFLTLLAAAAIGVGLLGLAASYQAVTTAARTWGFTSPWILPIAIDTAIPVFSFADLFLIRFDIPLAWARTIPWTLTAVTVYLNVQAGHDLAAKLAHGTLPLLWVGCAEIGAHVYRARIGALTGRRMERVRRSRWLLAPVATGALWRRMVLWEVTSYRSALGLERERILSRAELRERHGRLWRWKAPIRERALLRLGELAPATVSATPERERPSVAPDELPALDAHTAPALTAASVSAPAQDESADPEHAQGTPAQQQESAPERQSVSAAPAERPSATVVGAKVSALADARSAVIRPLYSTLGRRPEWTEIRDALVSAGHPLVSRPTAQRIRERLEAHDPTLAAIARGETSAPTGTDQ